MAFTQSQTFLLISACILIAGSIILYSWKRRAAASVLLLFAGSFLLRIFYASLDPFLNQWDEQFHALVAKNMMQHPFVPTLYEKHALNYDPTVWLEAHVWLHKQPLFLWQMSLSYKVFGLSELSTRLPSVILSSLAVLLIYRIGKLSINERAGYIAACLYAVAYYSLELILNRVPTDHNDVAFHFYVTASTWSWVEYRTSGKLKWLLLTGVFSGMAVLVKWLTGLLVFAGWGLSTIVFKETRFRLSSYAKMAGAFAIALAVFLPWQLYIMNAFPVESAASYKHNALHLTTVVEGHGGGALFYFHNLRDLFGGGQLVPFLIIAAVIFFIYKVRDKVLRVAFVTFIIIIYLFFSAAATKMISFCYVVSPLIFIGIGTGMDSILSWIEARLRRDVLFRFVTFILLAGSGLVFFDTARFKQKHLDWRAGNDPFYPGYYKDISIIKKLDNLTERTVLLNCKPHQHIAAMFYHDAVAYARLATEEELRSIKAQGYTIAVFDDNKLPGYFLNDPAIQKIDEGYYRKR